LCIDSYEVQYVEPESLKEAQNIKRLAGSESLEACWVMIDDLHALAKESPGLRGDELVAWATYLENGGHVFPLTIYLERKAKYKMPAAKAFHVVVASLTPEMTYCRWVSDHLRRLWQLMMLILMTMN
jgi:hypothetical protein